MPTSHRDQCPRRRHRGQRRPAGFGIAAAQRHQEFADVVLTDLGQIVDSTIRQVLGVAAQVSAIGAQRVGRHAALDGQVVEVALQLCLQGSRHRAAFRAANAVGLSIHGLSTGRGCVNPLATACADMMPATAMALTISPLSTLRAASVEREPLQCHVGLFVMRLGPVHSVNRWPDRRAPIRR